MRGRAIRRFLRENGLSLVLFFVFFLPLLAGQFCAGHLENDADRRERGQAPLTYGEYLRDPHFWEATAENWESEFAQMFAYVVLTVFLFQKGSSESKKLDEPNEVDQEPAWPPAADAPTPVRHGGWALRLYKNSLSLAFLLLLLASFTLHAVSGRLHYNQEMALQGKAPVSLGEFLLSSRLWFQSLQNWQSEFLAIGSMVVLSIWLRQKGSPESKPVDAPHAETGS